MHSGHDHGQDSDPGASPESARKQLMWLAVLLIGFVLVMVGTAVTAGNRVQAEKQEEARLAEQNAAKGTEKGASNAKVIKSDEEWKKQLTPNQYQITRQCGTEPAFNNKYYNSHEKGVYNCVCCGHPLFSSADKYDSGTGWPSFTSPIKSSAVTQRNDLEFTIQREEVVCNHCGAHLGHVFPDGPAPGGMRYCINSASLDLEKRDDQGKGAASASSEKASAKSGQDKSAFEAPAAEKSASEKTAPSTAK
jgi:peptide-methionine (R)-S-oxide reductase